MKKIITLLTLLFCLNAKATLHTVFVSCIGINPATTNAACGDSIKWVWNGCNDSVMSTIIPLCATPWKSPINGTTSSYAIVVPCAGTYNYKAYCNTSYFTGVINVICSSCSASISGNTTICNGNSTTLTASGGTTYSWSPGGQTTSTITVSPTTNTNYTVTATTGTCVATATVMVTVNPKPTITIFGLGGAAICPGTCLTLLASGGTSYTWAPGGQTGSSISACPGVTTVYTVTGSNSFGCTGTAITTVSVNPAPTASFTPSSGGGGTMNYTDNSTISSGTIVSWAWSFPGGSPSSSSIQNPSTVTYSVSGNYTVCLTVTSNQGCKDSTCRSVVVSSGSSVQGIENFSMTSIFPNPNNGSFAIQTKTGLNLTMQIHDVNGKLLFSQNIWKFHYNSPQLIA